MHKARLTTTINLHCIANCGSQFEKGKSSCLKVVSFKLAMEFAHSEFPPLTRISDLVFQDRWRNSSKL